VTAKLRHLLDRSPPDHSLPQPFYRDAEIYDFDTRLIYPRSWLMIGFEAELGEAGSYIALTIGANPVVVVRARSGEIVGYHNTCRHRGSQIVPDGHGRTPKLVCPYHKWTYDLDGRLIAAPRMGSDFETAGSSLKPITVRVVSGCIYIAMSSAAPDFRPFAAALEKILAPYDLAQTKLAHQSTLMENANWKLVMENARECYHCATGHPQLKVSFPVVINPGFDFGADKRTRDFLDKLSRLGLPPAPLEGEWWSVGRYPLNPGMESISRNGKLVVGRRITALQELGIGGVRFATEPNSFCHVLPDYAFMFTAIPVGPQETMVVSKWLVHKDAVEGIDYRVEELTETWTATNLQDRDLAENNQRGVNGLGYSPGKYSPEAEDFLIKFSRWYRATASRALAELDDE
jgi:glycine betaine catabolism A